MVEEAERSELARFVEHGKKAEAAIDAQATRWKTLFGANAARAGAADAILTVAKVEQIRRDLARGVDPAEIRRQVAVTEIAADIGRVNDTVARGRIPVLAGCLSPTGVAAEEDQLDGVRFARAQFKALRVQGGFAPLHDLLDQSDAYAAVAEREVETSGPSSTRRQCPEGASQVPVAPAIAEAVLTGVPHVDKTTMAVTEIPVAVAATTSPGAKAFVPAAVATRTKATARLRFDGSPLGVGFCVTLQNGSAYSCGGAGAGTPYGNGFANTGNPRSDIHAGANDGSFAQDNRLMSSKVEEASRNIALRITTTQAKVNQARQALPTWTATNTVALDEMSVRVSQAEAADSARDTAFRISTAPLLASVAGQLDAFQAGAADPAAVAALVRSVGGADLSLPDLARTALPSSVPAIVGVTGARRKLRPSFEPDLARDPARKLEVGRNAFRQRQSPSAFTRAPRPSFVRS